MLPEILWKQLDSCKLARILEVKMYFFKESFFLFYVINNNLYICNPLKGIELEAG